MLLIVDWGAGSQASEKIELFENNEESEDLFYSSLFSTDLFGTNCVISTLLNASDILNGVISFY